MMIICVNIFSGGITVVEKDIKKAFIDAFKKTDEDFLRQATKVLVLFDVLYVKELYNVVTDLFNSFMSLCLCIIIYNLPQPGF